MNEKIYFFGLVLITLIVIYYYITSSRDHRNELAKIERLEREQMERDKELEIIRTRTNACPVLGLLTPRSCYFDSNYQCTWNEFAKRCDKKE
uniref:CPW-WPC domain-containing protein n=1 Tax=viral metagenome TaxID=1070528 RepID=A0A6C0EBY5_9ZZZZ